MTTEPSDVLACCFCLCSMPFATTIMILVNLWAWKCHDTEGKTRV